MNRTLLDLAADYDREATDAIRWQTRHDRRDTAGLLRRMIGNRAAANSDRLTTSLATLLDIPGRWARQHGYRTVVAFPGWVVQRGDETALVVQPGDTIRWDGQKLRVDGAE